MNAIPKIHWITIQAFVGIAIYFSFVSNFIPFALFKGATTVLILLIPILYATKPFDKYTKLVLVGLVFCLAGDLLLLNEGFFVFGLGSFLIAHLFFMLAFLSKESTKHAIGTLFILSLIGGAYYWYLLNDLGALSIPVLVYVLVIILMAWRGIVLVKSENKSHTSFIPLAVILFMFSDAMIALNKFKISFSFSSILILSTYWLSIFLIARSTCANRKELTKISD